MKIVIAKSSHGPLGGVGQNCAAVVRTAACLILCAAQAWAGTEVTFKSTDLTLAANYSSKSLPTNTTDVLIETGAANEALLTDNGSVVMESLNLTTLSPGSSYTISNTSSTNSTLTLGSSASFTNSYSGVANDLIYLEDTSLMITGSNGTGYGVLGLALASSGNFDVDSNSSLLISSAVSGAGMSLTKTNSGTLELAGVNTFSGAFVATGGITYLDYNGALSNVSSLTVGSGATVQDGYTNQTNLINDAAAVTLNGTGILSLSGGSETVSSLSSTSATSSLVIGSVTLSGTVYAGSFTVGDLTNTTFAGTISGSPATAGAVIFTKQGTGTLTLTGNNTFTGGVAITAGVLDAAGTSTNKALGGAASIAVSSGGTLLMGAANQLNSTAPAAVTLTGATGTGNHAIFAVNGFSQGSTTASGVGALTLTSGSVSNILDFVNKAGLVSFASFTPNGAVLTVYQDINPSGTSGGPDELIFHQNESANYSYFNFGFGPGVGVTEALVSGSGSTAFYEVYDVDVPEPCTVLGGALLTASMAWSQRRRLVACCHGPWRG